MTGALPVREVGGNVADALVEVLDRVVDGGAVVSGDLVVSLAGVDLIRVDLRLLLVGVATAMEHEAQR